ncbi:dTDP-4-amino-4,6-dideoxygalactose transaminase [Halobacillus andaensis]|uniref:dTDP-4-amino-4,6-dideoxygalactose transaminase n=1 Tax=Halobacillus andaensis TaxID=1176239 RepID=A0A917EXQ7_HALAA|nr:dTDP-4-amino-4,6-dideoxygalactose transaminase [Halobacillus andaensis]MBP2005201.1 dTDP-4-amino-4,6-dideoxygalactose transaminase [Halobacillus andaensis]GGF29624.1 dTDP-4-amino-4,6-dideoxygalactose transaminase [Halobacillus andaensis]
MIPFNRPCVVGGEEEFMQEAISQAKLSGNGPFGQKCTDWLEDQLGCERAFMTPSCTAALEMAALLTEAGPEDEVIMPSYTFVSTANAFALRGAAIRFVDIDEKTLNIDPAQIKQAITDRTKAIVVVHYAGVACEMDEIMRLAEEHDLWVVEDAAQALTSTYKGKPLGAIGHLAAFSFHETKNYTCGEGGALIINHAPLIERAEMIQEKGTNRAQFSRGMVDKYSWRDLGSSYVISELNTAYLYQQLNHIDQINEDRKKTWALYARELQHVLALDAVEGPHIPDEAEHNAHMFYLKCRNHKERAELIDHLKKNAIMSVPHYVPLHSSHAGEMYGVFSGKDRYTTRDSERLVRLPLYYGMLEEDVRHVVKQIQLFYQV